MNKYRIILLFLFALLMGCSKNESDEVLESENTQKGSGSLVWLTSAGGKLSQYGQKVVVDPEGYLYVIGYFNGTAAFGTITLVASGENNTFVAKVDTKGNFIWAKGFGGTSLFTTDYPNSIAIDTDGNIYVTGMFDYKADFGSITVNAHNGSTDIYIAKLDKAGNFQWAKNAGGNQNVDHTYAICAGLNDNIYLTGIFYTKAWFDDIELSADKQGYYTFLAAMDKAGNFKWVKRMGTTSLLSITDLTTDNNGDLFLLGYYFGDENLGGVALLNNTQYAYTYVAKTNQYGVINWVQTTSSSDGGIFGRSVCADNSGNLYITGEFIKNGVVGSVSLSSATKDAFWAKIDSQGNWKWAKQSQTGSVIAENFCAGKSISVDAEGNPFLSWNFMGNTVLGNTTHQTNNFENGFWAKLNTDGSISWLKKTNSTGTANVNDLIPDNQGYLYLTGYYGNKAAFDSIQPTWRGSTDIFVLKSKQ